MNPLFEVRYVQDKALLQSFYRRIILRSPIAIFSYVFSAICLINIGKVLLAIQFVEVSGWQTSIAYYLVIIAILLGIQWFTYHQRVKMVLNQELELNQGMLMQRRIVVTESSITVHIQDNPQELSFASFRKVYETKTLILLITKAKQACIFPKASFILGTPEEFLTFLRSKGFQIR